MLQSQQGGGGGGGGGSSAVSSASAGSGSIGNRYDGGDVPVWVWVAGVALGGIALIVLLFKLLK